MPASDEHVPPHSVRDEIILKAVLPRVAASAKETGRPQSFRGVIRVRGQDVETFGATDGYWMVRLIVRHTFAPARDVFRVQALIPKHEPTGFHGFRMCGEIRRLEDHIEVVESGWTSLYNTTGLDDWS